MARCLALWSPEVTLRITRLNTKWFYVLPIVCISVICTMLKTKKANISPFRFYLLEVTITFVRSVYLSCLSGWLSVHLSIHMEQLVSHCTGFHEILYLGTFRKYVEKIQVSLKSNKNNGYFTRGPMYIYDNISLNSTYNEKCFQQSC